MAYVPPHRRQGASPRIGAALRSDRDSCSARAFARVRVVNLARRTDRLRAFDAAARRAGLAWERFEAADGSDAAAVADARFDERWDATKNAARDRHVAPGPRVATSGERGCALSHAELWREAASSEGWTLVVEDDCRFHPRWQEELAAVWPLVPSDASMVYLGFSDRGERAYVDAEERVFRPSYGFQTHCYAIREPAATAFLEALPVAGPVDVWLADNDWFGVHVYVAIKPGGGWRNTGTYLATQAGQVGDADVRQSSRDAAREALRDAAAVDGAVDDAPPTPETSRGDGAVDDAADALRRLDTTERSASDGPRPRGNDRTSPR